MDRHSLKNRKYNTYIANKIIDLIDSYFNVKSRSFGRSGKIIIPRQIAMYFIYTNLKISYENIGKLFLNEKGKNKNHASVRHGYLKINGLIPIDSEIRTYVNDLKEKVFNISRLEEKEFKSFELKESIREFIDDYSEEDLQLLLNELELKKLA